MSRFLKRAEELVQGLPRWAVYLLRGRNAHRAIQFFRKGVIDSPATPLLERVAAEYASAHPDESVLVAIGSLLPDLIRDLDEYGVSRYARSVKRYCEPKSIHGTGLLWIVPPPDYLVRLSKSDAARDSRLVEKTMLHDVVSVSKCADLAEATRVFAKGGTLWPLGEPAALKTTWQTDAERAALRESVREIHRPPITSRPATVQSPSANLPPHLASILSPGEFLLTFKAESQVAPLTQNGSLLHITPKRISRRFTFDACHTFREPAPRDVFEAELGHAEDEPRLQDLISFYKHHDGGTLFQSNQLLDNFHLLDLLGLEDQPAARASLRFSLDSRSVFCPGEHERVLAEFETTLAKSIVLVHNRTTFLVPTTGGLCGQVVCIYHCMSWQRVFATNFVDGLQRLLAHVHRYASYPPIGMKMGDESGDAITSLHLGSVRPR